MEHQSCLEKELHHQAGPEANLIPDMFQFKCTLPGPMSSENQYILEQSTLWVSLLGCHQPNGTNDSEKYWMIFGV